MLSLTSVCIDKSTAVISAHDNEEIDLMKIYEEYGDYPSDPPLAQENMDAGMFLRNILARRGDSDDVEILFTNPDDREFTACYAAEDDGNTVIQDVHFYGGYFERHILPDAPFFGAIPFALLKPVIVAIGEATYALG